MHIHWILFSSFSQHGDLHTKREFIRCVYQSNKWSVMNTHTFDFFFCSSEVLELLVLKKFPVHLFICLHSINFCPFCVCGIPPHLPVSVFDVYGHFVYNLSNVQAFHLLVSSFLFKFVRLHTMQSNRSP